MWSDSRSQSSVSSEADTAFFGGRVHTNNPEMPIAEAVAVRGGRIAVVGSSKDVYRMCGPSTDVVDLSGRMLVPGFQDSHVHPPMAGVEMLRCNLTSGHSRTDYLSLVADYAATHDEEWISGGGWSMPAFPGGVPVASDLDAIVGRRPVYLSNRDHHSAWVSSRALEIAGITAVTPDPPDGRIERDESGQPTGALHEGAMSLVERHLPQLSLDDFTEGLLVAQGYLHSLGVTAWQDAWVTTTNAPDNPFEAYLRLAGDGRLTARVVGALWWERSLGEEQVEGFVQLRERAAQSDRFSASAVKIMQDGVCETFTAAMLTPYLDRHGHETDECGMSFVEPEALKGHVTRLDAEGFQVHVHAIGDRAVREALDAIEAARSTNGTHRPGADRRHHLAHLQVVHPDDLARFSELGVVANFQPLWACAEAQMVDLTLPFLGEERSAQQYPIGSLASRGVPLAFGSDWPVSSPDPLAEMHVAVTRTPAPEGTGAAPDPTGVPPFLPDERIDLATALRAFTAGSAYVNHLEDLTGSVEVGKLADLVVVDRDLFEVDAADGGIAGAKVLLTMIEGKAVFESDGL